MVPAAEWRRIKASLGQREREKEEQCRARQCREDRRVQSQSIVKHWENTIEVDFSPRQHSEGLYIAAAVIHRVRG